MPQTNWQKSQLRQLMDQIRPYLRQYLLEHDIDAEGDRHFTCVSRYHEDGDPSMHIMPNTDGCVALCFGCSEHMDVFLAAHHLEGKPLSGPEWITDNVFYLADKFEIPHENIEFTPEQIEEMLARKLYRDTADIFKKHATELKWVEKRDWTPRTAKELELGTVDDTEKFYDAIKAHGCWTDDQLIDQGIKENKAKKRYIPRLFGKNRLTFLIRDEEGQPVGFGAKTLNKDAKQSYLNTKSRGPNDTVGSTIYSKSRILYGMHIARKHTHHPLHIFEGYADWVSAQQHGLKNCVALCGTAFTKEHLSLIRAIGFTSINFVMDVDEVGIKKMTDRDGYLQQGKGIPNFRTTITVLPFPDRVPEKHRDPDTFFRMNSLDAFLTLDRQDAFDWELKQRTEGGYNKQELADVMIDYLQNEANRVHRRAKLVRLAEKTDIPIHVLEEDFQRRFDEGVDNIITDNINKLTRARTTQERANILKKTVAAIEYAGIKEEVDISQVEVLREFREFEREARATKIGLKGYSTGFKQLDIATGGIPHKCQHLTFPGNSNSGKSATVMHIGLNLATIKANKDLTVCYWALDDPRSVAWARFLAILCHFPINDCAHPRQRIYSNKAKRKKYDEAMERIYDLMESNRLSIKGEETGGSSEVANQWVSHMQEKTGNNVILIVDSFHNVKIPGMVDETTKIVMTSDWLRTATQSRNFTAISTMECNKMGVREKCPRLGHLHGSRKMQYDMKFVGMVYNDLHANRERATWKWLDGDIVKPYIEISVEKNKLTSFKKTLLYKFYDDQSRIEEDDYEARKLEFGDPVTEVTGHYIVNGKPNYTDARFTGGDEVAKDL